MSATLLQYFIQPEDVIVNTVEEFAKLLQELRAAGQIGATILIVLLSFFAAACLWMLFLQKRFLTLASEAQKFIDAKMRAADVLREEDRKTQEISTNDVRSRIDSLAKINDELRKEIDRLAKQQKGLADSQAAFRQSVKDSITLGLDDIKERMTSMTLTEIVDQIPKNFKEQLQQNLVDVSKQVVADTIEKLKSTRLENLNVVISNEIQGAVISGFRELLMHLEARFPNIPREYWCFDNSYSTNSLDGQFDRFTYILANLLAARLRDLGYR